MRKFAVLVPGSATHAFFSQVAAISVALRRLDWTRWEPSLYFFAGGSPDAAALERWLPHLPDVHIAFTSSTRFAREGHWAQGDDVFREAPRDAEVFLHMDADVLPVAPFEDVLDHVAETGAVAGAITHYPAPIDRSRPSREAWQELADDLIDAGALDFSFSHTLLATETNDASCPFYVNFGVVFFAQPAFERVGTTYLSLRPQVQPRIEEPDFSGQVALALAIAREDAPTWALPMRFNFPNDPLAEQMYPAELENARLFHYLRTDEFDRQRIFADADEYAAFLNLSLTGVNARFRAHARRLLGDAYPFAPPQRAAARALEGGRPEEARALLAAASVGDATTPVARALDLIASGLVSEAAGAPESAGEAFDAAYELGVPLPVTLRASRDFFLRRGRLLESHHCATLLEALRPGALGAFLDALPEGARAGYASLTARRCFDEQRFFALRRVKHALVTELGEAGAALTLSELLLPGHPAEAVRMELEGLADHAKRRDLPVEEVVSPRRVHMASPVSLSEERDRGISGDTRSVFVSVIPDAVVSSKSALILADERAVMDVQGDELGLVTLSFPVDPVVLSGDAATGLTVMCHVDDARKPDLDQALSLVAMNSANWGHWVVECLFKLWACLDRPDFAGVPVLIDEDMPPQMRESLEAFVGDEHPIVELPSAASVLVRRLWACSAIAYWPGFEQLGTPWWPEQELADW
jgi:hypothetical protein